MAVGSVYVWERCDLDFTGGRVHATEVELPYLSPDPGRQRDGRVKPGLILPPAPSACPVWPILFVGARSFKLKLMPARRRKRTDVPRMMIPRTCQLGPNPVRRQLRVALDALKQPSAFMRNRVALVTAATSLEHVRAASGRWPM